MDHGTIIHPVGWAKASRLCPPRRMTRSDCPLSPERPTRSMSKMTVHMIGQAHLDPVWLWRWTEGRAEALGTSQSAIDRLAEYPDFHFTRGESQVYAGSRRRIQPFLREIKRAIAAGRWHVVNGMVIQPDMNIPSGESFVRQVLLGKRYMRDHLGVEPTVAYCVDSFGHAGTLPQILRSAASTPTSLCAPARTKGTARQRLLVAGARRQPHPHLPHRRRLYDLGHRPGGAHFAGRGRQAGRRSTPRCVSLASATTAAAPPRRRSRTCWHWRLNTTRNDGLELPLAGLTLICGSAGPTPFLTPFARRPTTLPIVADELQYHAVGCYSRQQRPQARPPPGRKPPAAGRTPGASWRVVGRHASTASQTR